MQIYMHMSVWSTITDQTKKNHIWFWKQAPIYSYFYGHIVQVKCNGILYMAWHGMLYCFDATIDLWYWYVVLYLQNNQPKRCNVFMEKKYQPNILNYRLNGTIRFGEIGALYCLARHATACADGFRRFQLRLRFVCADFSVALFRHIWHLRLSTFLMQKIYLYFFSCRKSNNVNTAHDSLVDHWHGISVSESSSSLHKCWCSKYPGNMMVVHTWATPFQHHNYPWIRFY